jgi:hypothetical protein
MKQETTRMRCCGSFTSFRTLGGERKKKFLIIVVVIVLASLFIANNSSGEKKQISKRDAEAAAD